MKKSHYVTAQEFGYILNRLCQGMPRAMSSISWLSFGASSHDLASGGTYVDWLICS